MNTVEEAVKDVHGLHSKLDRKMMVECANKTSSAQFKQVCTAPCGPLLIFLKGGGAGLGHLGTHSLVS